MSSEQMPLLSSRTALPSGTKDAPTGPFGASGFPLNIGHRGYKATFPENSMPGFQAAVAAGAEAVETDLHLSRDGVIVLSHDASLKRCFGIDKRVADCDWAELRELRTLREPRQSLARLDDLLAWLAQPEQEYTGLLLDVKWDDDPDTLLATTARTIAAVKRPDSRPWATRILVGAWTMTHIEATRTHLPGYCIFYTGGSLLLAHRLLDPAYDGIVNFNLSQSVLVGPIGARFLRRARERRRYVFVWTVNEIAWMKWAIRKEVEGVITDYVGRFADIRDGEDGDKGGDGIADTAPLAVGADGAGSLKTRVRYHDGGLRHKLRLYARAAVWQVCALLLTVLFWRRLTGEGGKRRHQGKPVVPGKA